MSARAHHSFPILLCLHWRRCVPSSWRSTTDRILPSIAVDCPLAFRQQRKESGRRTPGGVIAALIPGLDPSAPFFSVADGFLFPDHKAATERVGRIHELDAADNVCVVIAHDLSLRDRISLFPEKINGWKTVGLRLKTGWLF